MKTEKIDSARESIKRFLLIVNPGQNGSTKVREFDDERELRKEALEQMQAGETVAAYRVSAKAEATVYPALRMPWFKVKP